MRAVVCVGAVLCSLGALSVVGVALLRRSMELRVIPYLDGGLISSFDRPAIAVVVQLARAVLEPRHWVAGLANVVLLLVGIDLVAEQSETEVRQSVEEGIAEQQRLAKESLELWANEERNQEHEEQER